MQKHKFERHARWEHYFKQKWKNSIPWNVWIRIWWKS